jgi:hypothetical protein
MPMHRDCRPKSDSRRSTIIIMRATLHDRAPNTYYGQWLRRFAGNRTRIDRSIAQLASLPRALIHSI